MPCRSIASASVAIASSSWRSRPTPPAPWSRPRSSPRPPPWPPASRPRASPSSTARPPRSASALDGWLAAAAAPLARGLLLLIDYGWPAADLYDPIRRRDGTLRAYVRQTVHADPYRHIGRQDLTAHVDVSAVERAAHAAGLTTVGITTQAEALMGLGIERRLQAIQADPATTMAGYREVRGALMRLLDPAAMGRFRVMAFGRDWPATEDEDPPFGLFAFRMPSRPGRRA